MGGEEPIPKLVDVNQAREECRLNPMRELSILIDSQIRVQIDDFVICKQLFIIY